MNDTTMLESPTGTWITPACPLCGSTGSTPIATHRNTLFGGEVVSIRARCACGMVLTSPRPADDELGRYYESADTYYTHALETGARARIRRRLRAAQLRPPGSWARLALERATGRPRYASRWALDAFTLPRGAGFLDFGCGGGQNLEVAETLGLDSVGVDPDKKARDAAAARGVRCVADLSELPEHWRADRVLLSHVLEHLTDPVGTLRAIAAKTRPAARWLVRVPNAESWQAEACGERWIGYDMPRHLWHFSRTTLTKTLDLAGLRVLGARTVELPEFLHASLAESDRAGEHQDVTQIDPRALEREGRGAELLAIAQTTEPTG